VDVETANGKIRGLLWCGKTDFAMEDAQTNFRMAPIPDHGDGVPDGRDGTAGGQRIAEFDKPQDLRR